MFSICRVCDWKRKQMFPSLTKIQNRRNCANICVPNTFARDIESGNERDVPHTLDVQVIGRYDIFAHGDCRLFAFFCGSRYTYFNTIAVGPANCPSLRSAMAHAPRWRMLFVLFSVSTPFSLNARNQPTICVNNKRVYIRISFQAISASFVSIFSAGRKRLIATKSNVLRWQGGIHPKRNYDAFAASFAFMLIWFSSLEEFKIIYPCIAPIDSYSEYTLARMYANSLGSPSHYTPSFRENVEVPTRGMFQNILESFRVKLTLRQMPRDCRTFLFPSEKKRRKRKGNPYKRYREMVKTFSLDTRRGILEKSEWNSKNRQMDSLRATGNARFHEIPTYGFPIPTWMRHKPTLNARLPTRSCLVVVWKRGALSCHIWDLHKVYIR